MVNFPCYYILVVSKVGQYIDLTILNVEMDITRKECYFNRYECINLNKTLKIYLV